MWTTTDVERVVCNGRAAVVEASCGEPPALTYTNSDLRQGDAVALVLTGLVRTMLDEPVRSYWRRLAVGLRSSGARLVAFGALGHRKGWTRDLVAEFFERELGIEYEPRYVNRDDDALRLVEDEGLRTVLQRPHQFQQGGDAWRVSAPLKRLVGLDAVLRWERRRGERFRSVVVSRGDIVVPPFLVASEDATVAARIFDVEAAYLVNDAFAVLPRGAAASYLLQYELHLDLADLHRWRRRDFEKLGGLLRPRDENGPPWAHIPRAKRLVKGSIWQPTTKLAFDGVKFSGELLEVYTGVGGRFNQSAPATYRPDDGRRVPYPLSERNPCIAPYYILREADPTCLEHFPAKQPQACLRALGFEGDIPTCARAFN